MEFQMKNPAKDGGRFFIRHKRGITKRWTRSRGGDRIETNYADGWRHCIRSVLLASCTVAARSSQTLSGFQMNNPLPEFLEDENGFTPIDLFWEEDVSEDPNWMRKVTYRVGQIVVEFNSLEQEIDSCILDWMGKKRGQEPNWQNR